MTANWVRILSRGEVQRVYDGVLMTSGVDVSGWQGVFQKSEPVGAHNIVDISVRKPPS